MTATNSGLVFDTTQVSDAAQVSDGFAPDAAQLPDDRKIILELQGIMKEYDGETILAGCDLALRPGDFTVIVGESGCGKSTLLSIAGLLLAPSAGKVLVEGNPVFNLSEAKTSVLRAQTFGFVFQHTQLIGSLRMIDNVLVPACFGGADMTAAAQRAAQFIDRLGIAHRVQHFPHQLSVGQKRRAALARALLLEPLCIVADEPTDDLDAPTASIVMDALEEYAASGHAVLCATHDTQLALRASRVLRLKGGRLKECSTQDL